MATYIRSVVTIPHTSGLPRDAVQNTFAWRANATFDREDVADELTLRLDTFYTALTTVAFFSSTMATNSMEVKHYDYSDPSPRIPFREEGIAAGTGSTAGFNLPSEVALVLTIEGPKVSGVNMRRRRGRIYMGPISVGTGDNDRPASTYTDVLADAAEDQLLGAGLVTPMMSLAVYSRSTHFGKAIGDPVLPTDPEVPANLDDAFVAADKIWVDDSWDTQRRRGVSSTTRDLRSI